MKLEQSFLTQAEVDELPEGSHVIVTWSGGNGPHHYEVTKFFGQAYTFFYRTDGTPCLGHRIDFVGNDKPFTRVTLDHSDKTPVSATNPDHLVWTPADFNQFHLTIRSLEHGIVTLRVFPNDHGSWIVAGREWKVIGEASDFHGAKTLAESEARQILLPAV